jgi:hypothetical protein
MAEANDMTGLLILALTYLAAVQFMELIDA